MTPEGALVRQFLESVEPHHVLSYRGEAAFDKDVALRFLEYLSCNRATALGVEVWIRTGDEAPLIPQPYFYGWDGGAARAGETQSNFRERLNQEARRFIETFTWDEEDSLQEESKPLFNFQFEV